MGLERTHAGISAGARCARKEALMARFDSVLLLVLVLAPAAIAELLRQAPSIHAWIGAVRDWLFAWIGHSTSEPPPPDDLGPLVFPDGVQAPPPPRLVPDGLGPFVFPDGVQGTAG